VYVFIPSPDLRPLLFGGFSPWRALDALPCFVALACAVYLCRRRASVGVGLGLAWVFLAGGLVQVRDLAGLAVRSAGWEHSTEFWGIWRQTWALMIVLWWIAGWAYLSYHLVRLHACWRTAPACPKCKHVLEASANRCPHCGLSVTVRVRYLAIPRGASTF